MPYYELGNCLRGYVSGKYDADDEAWEALSEAFNSAYPSLHGRTVELKKVIREGQTRGGNETDQQRELREALAENVRKMQAEELEKMRKVLA